MALALVLLAGAGLLVRTFLHLMQVDLGIDPNNVVTMEIDLPHYKYVSPTQQTSFYEQLLERVQNTPGVASLALSRVMAGYVYGIRSTDPLTYAVAALLLLITAFLACYLPARRAMRVEPTPALRVE